MMRKPAAFFLLFGFTFLLLTAAAQNPPASSPETRTTYIKAGRLFDGTSDKVRDNVVIVVEGERIKSIGLAAEVRIPAGATVVDLSRATVLPGLIDCHTHLS
ncbi:MAG: amidohydrolase family protein, partial [Terriglobales bacterium]